VNARSHITVVTVSAMWVLGCMVDLAFVLDSSGSVENAWIILVKFLKTFVGMLNVGPKGIRIGLVEFGEFLFNKRSVKLYLLFHSFIHSAYFYSASKSTTTLGRSRLIIVRANTP